MSEESYSDEPLPSDSSSSSELDVKVALFSGCSICRYFANDQDEKGTAEALLETICPHCGIRLCSSHLGDLYSPASWAALLKFGASKPAILANCHECGQEFCKYRLFRDPKQQWQNYKSGPYGRTPLGETCLQLNSELDFRGSFVCELKQCQGTAFCSQKCKKGHVRKCWDCDAYFHRHSVNSKLCRDCCREALDRSEADERERQTRKVPNDASEPRLADNE